MQVNYTPEDLIKYEEHICELFAQKKIKAPIHLDNGNEEQLIQVFRDFVDEEDWCCGTWRMHYRALLKGVPKEELTQAILEGKSISLCFPKYKIIASAIVGGIFSIAVGIALSIKRKGEKNKVVCFAGDMGSETGMFHECYKYSINHSLPILWVVEDNSKSVCTDTREVWNTKKLTYEPDNAVNPKGAYRINDKVVYYKYDSKYPHAGGLERVNF
jgi:pyruvate dehydrogenase E1 component alpha subunit